MSWVVGKISAFDTTNDRPGEVSAAGQGRVHQSIDLRFEKGGGAVVPENKVGKVDFSRQRQLLGDSLPSEHARKAALLQSGELQGRSTGDAHGEIKPIFQGLFEEERNLHRQGKRY